MKFFLLSILIACGSPSTTAVTHSTPAPKQKLKPCTIEGVKEQLLCGTYAVWENRVTQTGRKIELAIVVLPALGHDVATDAIVPLAGGPGDSVVRGAPGWAEARELREHRDILLVDERGTGKSHPLPCRHPRDPKDVQGYFDPVLPLDEVRRCKTELEASSDLSQYTTSYFADDLDDVRAWLGYDTLDLVGGSYGTRAAQVYMRRHGAHVRTAALTGLVGMDQYLPLYHARDGKHSLDMVLAACASDKECAAAFPDIAGELRKVIAALDAAPGHATVDGVPVTFSRGVFAEEMRFALYEAGTSAALPYVIHRAAQGDFQPFARFTMLWEPVLRTLLSYGMHLSVTCAEDLPFITPAAIAPAIADTYLGDFRIAMQVAACKEWPRGAIPADFHAPVTSQVPIMIFSGPYDPVTPPRWAEAALPHFSHALHVVVPDGHHGTSGLSHPECDQHLTATFIERGTTDGLDTSCIQTMKPPAFVTTAAAFDALLSG